MAVNEDRALKVKTGPDVPLEERSRAPFDKIQQGIMYEGQTGYLSADDPYPNILFITDQRLLLFVGKLSKNLVIEFRYDDDDVDALTGKGIEADGLVYQLGMWLNFREVGHAFHYLHEETPLRIPSLESEKDPGREGDQTLESPVQVDDLLALTPEGFEEYVADVWRAQGYSCKLTKGSGDGGIDIIAQQGSKRELIQVKRYSDQNVGIETVQRTAGLLVDDGFNASSVSIVTSSGFTGDAKRRAKRINDLEIVDGRQLVSLGNECGVGVVDESGDSVYPEEVTAEQVLASFTPGEPLTTSEVIEKLMAPPHSVLSQLNSLYSRGEINAKRVGRDGTIWYVDQL
jgi:hypothetical protein